MMGETFMLTEILAQHRVLVPSREPDGFAAFWSAYPRKVGKGAARTAFVKALRKASVETILAGLARAEWSADPQYIPHPSTWLNAERWDDAPTERVDHVARILGL